MNTCNILRKVRQNIREFGRCSDEGRTVLEKIYGKKDTMTLQSELRHSDDVERFMEVNQSEFDLISMSEYLNELLKKYKLEKSDVVKRGGFTGTYLYHIFDGTKNPSRDKLIQLALGFPLTLEETQKLLRLGGYAELYVRDSRDAFLMFGLEKKYAVQQLNELLYKNKKKILE